MHVSSRPSSLAKIVMATAILALTATQAAAQVPAQAPAQAPAWRTKVTGEVIDSTRNRPLANATVQLVDAAQPGRILATRTDERGTFVVDSVTPGVYLAGFLHPRLDSLGLESTLLRLEVSTPDLVRLPLGVPSASTIITARCGPETPDMRAGLFFGTVRSAATGAGATGARVRAQFSRNVVVPRGIERRPQVSFGTATADGTFAVCGVPPNAMVVVRGFTPTDSSGFVELTVPANGLLVRDLFVGTATRTSPSTERAATSTSQLQGTARVRGLVRSAAGRPVNGARLVLWGAGRDGSSNAAGQYALNTLPEGSYMLEVRAVGFQPLRVPIDLRPELEVVSDITLSPLVASVDTMRVRADRMTVPLEEFNRRRRLGFGHFLDEAAITKKGPTYMADIFRGTPGIVTMPGEFGRDRVLLRGTGMTGDCAPAVFINGMFVNIEDGDMDVIINPKDVRAVEIYARTSSIPIQFEMRNGCGSVVIWTGARTSETGRQ